MHTHTAPGSVKTILFAHYGNDWIRGSEQCLLDLVKYLDRSRFRCVVLCNSPELAGAVQLLNAPAIVHPALTPARLFSDRLAIGELTGFCERESVRLIHVNTSLLVPLLLPVARKLRAPILAQLHIVPTVLERRHELLHQLSMVVGVSKTSVQGFVEEGMDLGKVRVIYNGVDGARIAAGDATGLRGELGIPPDSIVLGAIGSLIQRKGVDILLDTMRLLRTRLANVHLIIAGDGDQRGALEKQMHDLQVDDVVHFLGERRDAGAILRDSVDIAVSASRGEAFPLNVLEAGYFGRPMVVSDIPPHHESVLNGKTGIIVENNTAEAFSLAIADLANDHNRQQTMGLAAQRRVQDEFSLAKNVQLFQDTYNELVSRPAREFGWLAATTWPKTYNGWIREAIRKRIRL